MNLQLKTERVQVANGLNLGLLGRREPAVYGGVSFEDYLSELHARFPQYEISYYRSNVEGEIINKIHEVGPEYDGIVLNAGAYIHTSVALHGAIKAVTVPVVEVYVSNVHACESFYHMSMISVVCRGVILGFGLDSHRLAIESFM